MRDIRLLLDFAVVAEELSFTRAARRLGVAQPWLSGRIRKLEDQFGRPLLERSTRSVALTTAGEELLCLVAPLARAAEVTLTETERLRTGASGRLRIGCPQLGAPDRLQGALISRFAARNPDTILEIEPGSPDIQLDLLHRGVLDFMLTIQVIDDPRLEALPLHRVDLAMLMHAHDPLAGTASLTPAAFAGRRVAVFDPHRAPQLHRLLYAPLAAAGADLVMVPELRRSLLRDSADLIVSTLVPAPADAVLGHGVVRRTVREIDEVWLKLVRRREAVRPRVSVRFWSSALALVSSAPRPVLSS